MDSKADLIKYIKEWVKVDNEIRQLKKEETKRKNEQKAISKELMRIMSENEIDEFDLRWLFGLVEHDVGARVGCRLSVHVLRRCALTHSDYIHSVQYSGLLCPKVVDVSPHARFRSARHLLPDDLIGIDNKYS